MAQDDCGSGTISAAESSYEIGKFDECIGGLTNCIANDGFAFKERIQAYALCAKCYLAKDTLKAADHYIRLLLSVDDNFQPEEHDPFRFKQEVALIRNQMRAHMTSSVSKRNEDIDHAPATMFIITAKDILDRGYQDVETIFHDIPGFDVTTSFGISYSNLYQRGYRSPSFTERTMVMIDGVEDNDIWSNAALIAKQYPVSSIKRVEVIYGPASTIYGANAFCGVINIVTKDEEDFFPSTGARDTVKERRKNKDKEKERETHIALAAHTGYASYNSRYGDATVSAKNKNVFLSVTGRVYQSDGIDLSPYPDWNGRTSFTPQEYANKLTIAYTADTFKQYQKLDPTGQYFYVRGDSIAPTAKALARADALDQVLLSKIDSPYKNRNIFRDPLRDYYISAKLSVGNFKFGCQYWDKNDGSTGDYLQTAFSPNSAYTSFQIRNYFLYARYDKNLSERLSLSSLTYYRYQDYGNNFKTTGYKDYGNGSLSGINLITGSGKAASLATTNFYAASNQVSSELKLDYRLDDRFSLLGGVEFRTGISQKDYIKAGNYPTYTQVLGTINPTPGGNSITEYTTSGYLTGSYHNSDLKLNIDLGGRLDNNKFSQIRGYGTQFNPRIAVISYPGNFVFKAIYAEAFLDASNLNKFSTSSTRLLSDDSLKPEKVKNLEISARFKFSKRSYLEVAAYRSEYSHCVGLVSNVLTPDKSASTTQFQDIGRAEVYGIQAASEIYIVDDVTAFSNLTFTDPRSIYSTKHGDSAVRTGDIAYVSANAGVNVTLFKKKLNLNARVNIVGDKPTGHNTSIPANYLNSIAGYQVLNGAIGYKVYKDLFMLQAGCNNILNTLYYSPGPRAADGVQFAYRVPQPLRNYFVRLVVNFKY